MRFILSLLLLSFAFLMQVPSLYSLHSNKVLQIAEQYLFVREIRANRSPEIDSMNRNTRSPLGSSWCAGYVYFCLDKAGIIYPQKKNALARSLVIKTSYSVLDVLTHKIQIKASDILIWQKGKTINGHTGFAYSDWAGTSGKTIEGNTSSGLKGSQSDGDGVYIRNRRIEPMNYFRIKWITRL